MKKVLCLCLLLISKNVQSQDIKIVYDKFVDNFYSHTIRDIKVFNGLIYILGKVQAADENSNIFYLTLIDLNGDIKKQIKIDKSPEIFLDNITKTSDFLLITGSSFLPGENTDLQDYALLYDKNFNLLWKKKLEIKHEGKTIGLTYNDNFLIATNNNSNIVLYVLDLKGYVIKRKELQNLKGGSLDGVYQLDDRNIMLAAWSIGSNTQGYGQINLVVLSNDLEILAQQTIPINRIDYIKNISSPENIKPLSNTNIALLWTGIPPMTMISNPFNNSLKTIEHIRHDIEFQDIENFKNDTYVYSGKLGSESAFFLINQNNIIAKLTLGNMGIWSQNKVFRISTDDYVIVSDIIKTSDFQSNIKITRVKIK